MSKVKRILSVIMAMVMVLAMSVPTFATEVGTAAKGKAALTVTGLVQGEKTEVRVYKEPGRGAFHFRLFRHQRAAGLPGEGEHRGALDPFGRQAGARNAAPPDDQSGRQGFDQ